MERERNEGNKERMPKKKEEEGKGYGKRVAHKDKWSKGLEW